MFKSRSTKPRQMLIIANSFRGSLPVFTSVSIKSLYQFLIADGPLPTAILVVEYPQNYIIARVPIAKYLSFS